MARQHRRTKSIIFGMACLVASGVGAWALFARSDDSVASRPLAEAGETTASIAATSKNLGPSGLPLPRFVSLKAEKVNVRRGPNSDYPVSWVFQRKGLPVEIIAESENWRRIRDSEGAEGWILQNMLSGKRTAMVAPWRRDEEILLHAAPAREAGLVAKVTAGVVAEVSECGQEWCAVSAGGYDGFIEQSNLWGVYPGETVD
jgi:SH3-like domain-containing protein